MDERDDRLSVSRSLFHEGRDSLIVKEMILFLQESCRCDAPTAPASSLILLSFVIFWPLAFSPERPSTLLATAYSHTIL